MFVSFNFFFYYFKCFSNQDSRGPLENYCFVFFCRVFFQCKFGYFVDGDVCFGQLVGYFYFNNDWVVIFILCNGRWSTCSLIKCLLNINLIIDFWFVFLGKFLNENCGISGQYELNEITSLNIDLLWVILMQISTFEMN